MSITPSTPLASGSASLQTFLIACEWAKRSELQNAPVSGFDYQFCIGVSRGGDVSFHHFLHQLNPDRFRSPSNDVSGSMGLLGGMESEARVASFDRAVGDVIHVYASDALSGMPLSAPVRLLARGPLFPKLRGRFLMSGVAENIRIYFVTRDPAWLEQMDLQGSLEVSSPEEFARQLSTGEATSIIPPAGQDKGTRCWLVKNNAGSLVHFELVTNMYRGVLPDDWQKERNAEVKLLADDEALEELARHAKAELQSFYKAPAAISRPRTRGGLPEIPVSAAPARSAAARDRFGELPIQAQELFLAYKPFFTRKGWDEFATHVDMEFWPAIRLHNRTTDAISALEAFRPKYIDHIDPLQNRIRAKIAIRRLRRLLSVLLAS